ncbi:hypothetical protein [Rossellomorea aquimaris]|uniref:Uncharacterized protein n=1 Tax=Rossellomorea aquimaris TaxID=189382 RepID=A0A5D4TS24_9BACI|nr:hypothetical protein [Rossellomorea aquimaris]TYS78527.1 hypothetical protein FZC80_12350 [Rossellomorea aquimaris]
MFTTVPRHTEKVDKGFAFNYFRLSYRRKMIRTIWVTLWNPVIFILLRYVLEYSFYLSLGITLISVVGNSIQIYYTYYMWNKYERGKGD